MLKISSNKVIRVGCALNWMFLLSNKSSNCCSPKIRDHLFFFKLLRLWIAEEKKDFSLPFGVEVAESAISSFEIESQI